MADRPRSSSPHTNRALRRRGVAVVGAIAALAALGACSSDDGASDETASTSTSTTAASQFGSSMGVEEISAAEVSELGDGPTTGESWTIPVGLSICGRFIEPLTGTDGAVTAQADGTVTVTGDGTDTPTVGDLARASGIVLEPGSITMPSGAVPAELDSTDPPTPVAGATLRDGDSCGTTEGAVEIWVYSAAATESGDGIMVVTDDPAAVPFAEEGMSIVVAFAPESSLPTLPPSALARG